MTSPDPIKVLSHGGQPEWEQEFDHPVYGKLTFTAKLPTAGQTIAQSVSMDNLLRELGADVNPSGRTLLMASAITGLQNILTLPVVDEKRSTDEDEEGYVKVTQVLYDPLGEPDIDFVIEVWSAFWMWRQEQLERVGELKNSSGETNGNGSSESSTVITDSLSTTPA